MDIHLHSGYSLDSDQVEFTDHVDLGYPGYGDAGHPGT
jgi:hypothetical protein